MMMAMCCGRGLGLEGDNRSSRSEKLLILRAFVGFMAGAYPSFDEGDILSGGLKKDKGRDWMRWAMARRMRLRLKMLTFCEAKATRNAR
jgi:hypothetical protein